MKRLQKVLIFVALMVCSVYGIVFMHADPNQNFNPVNDRYLYVSGTAHYDQAQKMLDLINKYRVENGRTALTADWFLWQESMDRALEAFITSTHARPNTLDTGNKSAQNYKDKMELYCGLNVGDAFFNENLGGGYSSAESMFEAWKNSTDGHNGTMLEASYQSAGIACVEIKGNYIWIFIPSSLKATNYKPVTTQGSQKIERPIYIQDKYLGTFILGANIEVGESRDGNGSCYIKTGAGQGLLLKLPQSGVSFSTTSDKIHVDSASGTVTGLHAGAFDITMTVNGVSFTNQYTCWGKGFNDVTFNLEKSSFDYTGKEIKPKAALYDTARKYTLVEGTDYTVEYGNNVNAGTGWVSFEGMGDYGSQGFPPNKVLTFTINSAAVSPKQIGSCAITNPGDCYANGSAQKPAIKITDGNVTLTENQDYTLTYTDNINAGIGKVTITGINKYAGTVVKTFTVRSQNTGTGETTDIAGEPVITLSGYTFTYTGQAVKPKVTMKFRGFEMAEGSCYTVEYLNNVNPGTATVRVKGTGAFSGHKDLTFTIIKKSSSSTVSNKSANSNTPANGNTATNTVKKTFSIKLSFKSKTYSGKALKPKVKVSYGGKKLSAKNYKVSYKNNKNSGIAAVIVTGKGSYKGVSGRAYFTIVPKKVSQKTPAAKKGALTVKWKKDASAGGYQIQVSTRKNFRGAKTYTTGKKSSYTIRKLQRKTKYYVRIRAYKKSGGTTIWGAWSSTKNKKTK